MYMMSTYKNNHNYTQLTHFLSQKFLKYVIVSHYTRTHARAHTHTHTHIYDLEFNWI